MSLKIYTDKKDISKSVDFVFDPDSYMIKCGIKDNDFNRMVLSDFEKGSYLDENSFIDRLGFKLNKSFLSTSSKVMMCVNAYPDKVFNGMELGSNAGRFLLKMRDGGIYLPRYKLGLNIPYGEDIDVVLNGKRFTKSEDLALYAEDNIL